MRLTDKEQREVIRVLREYDIPKAAIFGSYARGEATESSDLDILIERSEGFTLLDLGGLYVDLRRQLGRSVDIVMYSSIHPKLRESILASAQELPLRVPNKSSRPHLLPPAVVRCAR